MRGKRTWALLAGLALALTACSDSTPTSTLAPGTTAPLTTVPTTTVTTSPTTTTTTTMPPTTTTQSPDERLAEIQALAKATFVGRLNAIFHEGLDALRPWMGSQASYDGSIEAMDRGVYLQEPTADNVGFLVDDVLLDREDCVVVLATVNTLGVLEGSSGSSTSISVYWPDASGRFLDAAVWQQGTPRFQWMEECDIAIRGVTP